MHSISEIFTLQFILPLLLNFTALICSVIVFIRRRSHPELKWFSLYAFLYFGFGALAVALYFSNSGICLMLNILRWANIIYVVELFVYYVFFRPLLNRKQRISVLFLSYSFAFIYIAWTMTTSISELLISPDNSWLYASRSAILITMIVFYIYNLFTNSPVADLKRISSFWIATGLFFMSVGMLSFSIAQHYLVDKYMPASYLLFDLFGIFVITNFLLIIKASLCKPAPTLSSSL